MNPPRQPDDPWDEDTAQAMRKLVRVLGMNNYGNIDQRPAWSTWILGIFAALIVLGLGGVMQALYSTNGDLREWRGQTKAQNESFQAELLAQRAEINLLTQEVGVINGSRQHP